MKTYTIVYEDLSGNVQVYTTPADGVEQALCVFERDPDASTANEIFHVIQHKVPKLTLCFNRDIVETAYSDSAVELLLVHTDRDSMIRAIEHDEPVMPDSRQTENLPSKLGTTCAFNLVEVGHSPLDATFDHEFATDDEREQAYFEAVRKELEES